MTVTDRENKQPGGYSTAKHRKWQINHGALYHLLWDRPAPHTAVGAGTQQSSVPIGPRYTRDTTGMSVLLRQHSRHRPLTLIAMFFMCFSVDQM